MKKRILKIIGYIILYVGTIGFFVWSFYQITVYR